jgi:hypothetical protein
MAELGRFEVFMVVVMKILVFWDVVLCLWLSSTWYFEGLYCLHHRVPAVQEQPFRGTSGSYPPLPVIGWPLFPATHINSCPCMSPTFCVLYCCSSSTASPLRQRHCIPSEGQVLLAHWHSVASLQTWIFYELTCLLSYSWRQLMRRASCWWVKWMDKSLTVMMSCWGCEESTIFISLITVSSLWIILRCVHKTATRGISTLVLLYVASFVDDLDICRALSVSVHSVCQASGSFFYWRLFS